MVYELNDVEFLMDRLGRESWTVTCTLACKKISLATSDILPDTGASSYLFTNRDMAKKALQYLRSQRLANFPPQPIARFDGKAT